MLRAVGPRAWIAVFFALPGCDGPLGPTEATVLSSDLRGNQWVITDLRDDTITDSYPLSELDPGVCEGAENPVHCLLFESRVRDAADGASEIDFTWSALDSGDGDDEARDDLLARLAGVDREDHSLRWSVRGLDFGGFPETGCSPDPADPCAIDPMATAAEAWTCSLRMAHTVWVTEETDADVSMWVVDSRNNRLVDLTVPRDGTCAVVNRLVDSEHAPDWDVYVSVNSLKRAEIDGEETLLMTVKGSLPDTKSGEEQEGGSSRGKVLLWREDPLAQLWEFPPETTGTESFANTPHGVTSLERPDGERWVLFAQSLGASDRPDYGFGSGGSVTVLRLDADGPVYLYDAVLPESQGVLRFPRDITPLPDGRVLVSDSGCLGDRCDYPTGLWVLDLPDAAPTGKTGAWSADHAEQELLTVEADDGPYLSALDMIFSTDVLPGE